MNMTKHQRWLAGALCLTLAACSNMDRNSGSMDSSNTSSMNNDGSSSPNNMAGTASSPSSASGAMNSASTTGSDYRSNNPGGTASAARTDTSTPANSSVAQTSYGSVLSIDPMQRQDVGVGAVGAAAAGGTMGAPTDRVYRVSVRMDDGTTQTVVVDTKPSYKTGDRVRYNNGMLEKY